MCGFNELRHKITISKDRGECPVKNCDVIVHRQRGRFKRDDAFFCPKHEIYVSPSTFEYKRMQDNLLWKSKQDMDLLNRISRVKRESRITRDNSEDAVTWNVFRFLEQKDLLSGLLTKISSSYSKNPEIIYWSYSQKEKNTWSYLDKARKEFELNPDKGSEPDVIVKKDDALFFVEAKFLSGNNTRPSSKNAMVQKKYETGGNNWFSKVFSSKFLTVAVENQKYELLRFWLLGTWIAKEENLDFYLLNLVLFEMEKILNHYLSPTLKRTLIENFCD